MRLNLLLLSIFSATSLAGISGRVAYFPMDSATGNQIQESVSGAKLNVEGQFNAETGKGVVGNALRFDGYSTFVKGTLPAFVSDKGLTVKMWVAPETYPVIKHDEPSDDKARIAGNLNHVAKEGWEITLGKTGKYAVSIFTAGRLVTVEAEDILPRGEWSHIEFTLDLTDRYLNLYRNGKKTGSTRTANTYTSNASTFTIGKDENDVYLGPFRINTFNGLIDEIEVFDTPLPESELFSGNNAGLPDFKSTRFDGQKLRPTFHGMPSANWTNETHGMTYSGGKYHVFFQKNGNGPYMSRLHWGHISSSDLCTWEEEPIAITPDEWYDIKGCWSGCVFTDNLINDGQPTILYTGVDYGMARIIEATPAAGDTQLHKWNKKSTPAIDGRPGGLSDDFRDPYYFRNGNNAYIIVGSNKDGKGVCTLHKRTATGSWTNDGDIFFQASNPATMGTFWEMPNITKMDNGEWLFTTTPQGLADGVKTLYWTGRITDGGKFSPTTGNPKQVELISRDGFGLLSPTIYQHNGKTIALGIVPDKLPGEENYKLGWAHTYSLPREWSLDNEGNLLQKPYEGLASLRSKEGDSEIDFDLNGTKAMKTRGNRVEILGEFEVGTSPFGFNFLKNGNGKATLTYTPSTRELKIDFTALPRIKNDSWAYNGIYSCTLPSGTAQSGIMKINMFIDGSILDIFINDSYATSIRVFPTDEEAGELEIFSTAGNTKVKQLKAWSLAANGTQNGIEDIPFEYQPLNNPTDVYTLNGQIVKKGVKITEATDGLASGIYIIAGRKVMVK